MEDLADLQRKIRELGKSMKSHMAAPENPTSSTFNTSSVPNPTPTRGRIAEMSAEVVDSNPYR